MLEPALGIVELASIARGIVVVDAMVKRAPVRVVQNHPISPGRHLVVLWGGVAEVEEAMAAGLEAAAHTLVDKLLLPQAHEQLAPLLAGQEVARPPLDAVGVVELTTVASTVLAADAAAKAARITLLDMRLGTGIGGKGFFTMTGDLNDIEAALAAAQAAVEPALLVGTEIIRRPHEDLHRRLLW